VLAARGAAEDGWRRRDGVPIYPKMKTVNRFAVFAFGLMPDGRGKIGRWGLGKCTGRSSKM